MVGIISPWPPLGVGRVMGVKGGNDSKGWMTAWCVIFDIGIM